VLILYRAFGSVYKAKYKPTGQIVAVKKIELEEEKDADEVFQEIKILKSCNSDFIVGYFGTFKESEKCYWVYNYFLTNL
jgi:serine/threonine protein kinase